MYFRVISMTEQFWIVMFLLSYVYASCHVCILDIKYIIYVYMIPFETNLQR